MPKPGVAFDATALAIFAFAKSAALPTWNMKLFSARRRHFVNGAGSMIKFFKRAFDAYVRSVGKYPMPMAWAF